MAEENFERPRDFPSVLAGVTVEEFPYDTFILQLGIVALTPALSSSFLSV